MAKADNLLAVLWLLRSRRRLTAAQLAAALETSLRTVYRYIDSLCASGVPIVAESGHDGGYSLAPGFQAAPLIFSPLELKALFHAARFAEQGGYPYSKALEGALAKVRTTLTPAQNEHLEREISVLTVVSSPRGGPVGPWLEPLEQAVSEGATLRLTYHKLESREPEIRVVDPYGLAAQRGLWYLVGFCHARRALRDFRVDRILELQLTGERFERPASFAVSEHFTARMREQANTPPFTAVHLRGHPSAIASLWDHHYLRHCRVERSRQEATFRLDAQGCLDLPSFLLPYGIEVTVVEPDSLRVALAELAERWVRHHGKRPQLP